MRANRTTAILATAVLLAGLSLGACGTKKGDDQAEKPTTTAAGESGSSDDETTTTEPGGSESDDETTTTEDEGGDSDGPVDVDAGGQEYADAISDSMTAGDDMILTDDQADCFAARTVNTIGVDRLKASGVTPAEMSSEDAAMDFSTLGLSEDDAREIYGHFESCGVDLKEMMIQSMATDDELTPAMKACMESVLTSADLEKFIVSVMMNGDDQVENDPELSEFMGGLMGCAFMGMGDMNETTTTVA